VILLILLRSIVPLADGDTREGGRAITTKRMVKVSVEVRSGTSRFRVGVQVESIRKALSVVGGRYPRGEVRLEFPVEPEGFFAGEPTAVAGMGGTERVHREAA
jgi:hypothetical protein